jgi:hypothetical protein
MKKRDSAHSQRVGFFILGKSFFEENEKEGGGSSHDYFDEAARDAGRD